MTLLQRPKSFILYIIFVMLIPLIGTNTTIGNQTAPLLILQTSKNPLKTDGPISALATSPNQDETVYIANGLTGEVQAYRGGSSPSYRPFAYTNGPFVIQSSNHIAYIDKNSNVVLAEPGGKITSKISTPPAISLAALSNGNIVTASPSQTHFLNLYTSKGQLIRSFGIIKKHKSVEHAETQFLHKGKLVVDAADNIYYVYHYIPLIQKFSPRGELELEIKVEGDAINLQQELAQVFFSNKARNTVGGITIINSAAIDLKTGHLWISLNGSSNTGTVYEYNTNGEKLREYALEVNTTFDTSHVITGVSDIAISDTKLYVLSSLNQVFEFERSAKPAQRTINRLEQRIQEEKYSIKYVTRTPLIGKSVRGKPQSCGTAQTWNSCQFNCPDPVCNGTTPTATSSDSAQLDCKAELMSTLAPGYVVISSPCTPYAAGTPMHMRGGCMAAVTICRDGINSNHNLTLDCTAPECSNGFCDVQPPVQGCGECRGWSDWPACRCEYVGCSPIVVDTLGNGFDLTARTSGVSFDLNGDGISSLLSWTASGSDDAFLALDRNGNGLIDNGKELFGSFTQQPISSEPNGFIALTEYDKTTNGGNSDGKISSNDAVFSSLRLWRDLNHNAMSEPNELFTLPALGIASIELDYKESKKTDEPGNQFRYRAKVKDTQGQHLGRWAWDVFLLSE